MSFYDLDVMAQAQLGHFFPPEDSQYFSDVMVDPAIRKETDGGLIFTRRQYRRDPARKIVTGFTNLPHIHKNMLDQLWKKSGGGADSFLYVHPLDGSNLIVRFEDMWTATYKGIGTYKVWDITQIKLRTI